MKPQLRLALVPINTKLTHVLGSKMLVLVLHLHPNMAHSAPARVLVEAEPPGETTRRRREVDP
jgi:hypothetical protein